MPDGTILNNVHFQQPLFKATQLKQKGQIASKAIESADLQTALKLSEADATKSKFTVAKTNENEILGLYNAAVKDGRYVNDLAKDPAGVASKLKLKISAAGVAAIQKAGGFAGAKVSDGDDVSVVCVAVVVVVCCVAVPERGGEVENEAARVVVDASGEVKL